MEQLLLWKNMKLINTNTRTGATPCVNMKANMIYPIYIYTSIQGFLVFIIINYRPYQYLNQQEKVHLLYSHVVHNKLI